MQTDSDRKERTSEMLGGRRSLTNNLELEHFHENHNFRLQVGDEVQAADSTQSEPFSPTSTQEE